jgi:hypothetical protein
MTDKRGEPFDGREAAALAQRVSAAERERLLIACWMSHDARWLRP